MTTVTSLGPNLGFSKLSAAPSFSTGISANRTGNTNDCADLRFGSNASGIAKAPKATSKVIPILGPILAGAAAAILIPFKALCAVKGCMVSCCIGAVAVGALLGLTLFK